MRAPTFALLALFALSGCGSADDSSSEPSVDTDAATDDTAVAVTDSGGVVDSESEQPMEGEAGIKCPTPPMADPGVADRTACKFVKGAKVATTLGITAEERAKIPLTHLVIVMNENRSFDHYFGHLATEGQPEAEALPATYTNKDAAGKVVKPFHMGTTCIERDPPHGWTAYQAKWNAGKMDGFITQSDVSGTSNGYYALGYLSKADAPFYNWLATTWAISDRYFASVIGPTWPNRDYLYAATSDRVKNTGERKITVPNIFDALDGKKVKWAIYGDGGTRSDCVGIESSHPNHLTFKAFLAAAKDGTLPPVSFLDPTGAQDEHPGVDKDMQGGEAWARAIYEAARTSPLWPKMAVIYTYDEGGGIFDHVPPPKSCLAASTESEFNHLGPRVPLFIMSPYSRPHFVSHKTHEHTSITRLIELVHDLPAMTARDANSDALLDMFDFNCPTMLEAPAAPPSGKGGCP